MINSEKRNHEKILVVITAIVVLSALTFSIIIEPQLKGRKSRLDHMNKLQLKLTKMTNDVSMKERTDKLYSVYEPFIAGSGTDQDEISLYTRELRSLYQNLKVNIRTVTINPIVREDFFKQLSVKIEMSGNIKEILKFIYMIDNYNKPIHTELLDIISQEPTDTVKASFVITKVVAEDKRADTLKKEADKTVTDKTYANE